VGCLSRGGPDLLDIGEWDGARPHLECAMGNGGRECRKLLDEIVARDGANTTANDLEPRRAELCRRDRRLGARDRADLNPREWRTAVGAGSEHLDHGACCWLPQT